MCEYLQYSPSAPLERTQKTAMTQAQFGPQWSHIHPNLTFFGHSGVFPESGPGVGASAIFPIRPPGDNPQKEKKTMTKAQLRAG